MELITDSTTRAGHALSITSYLTRSCSHIPILTNIYGAWEADQVRTG
jgi:hypothetical protein